MKFATICFGLLAAGMAHAASELTSQPAPFPVFLKFGFSSVLEFDEFPTRVVLGDAQAFQVERLDRSLVLRTMVPYATSNMFVYFRELAPRLFVLSASEDANPTYYKKIESPKPVAPAKPNTPARSGPAVSKVSRVVSAQFDAKKDYLTIEVLLAADSSSILRPNWDLVRLRYQSKIQAPFKLWSERKDVQKDASTRARFIFAKPNVPRDLSEASLLLPLEGQQTPLSLSLRGILR